MVATVTSVAQVGIEPRAVRVETHIGPPKPQFTLVGLPDTAVREARERVRAAMVSSGYTFPERRVTVNLAPADLPKAGSAYDLPIALGVLAADGTVPPGAARVVALGELALDGSVRRARGAIGAAVVASRLGLPCLVAPEGAAEASRVPGVDLRPVRTLAEAVSVALGETAPVAVPTRPVSTDPLPDLADVRGQPIARRALEIAAAGGHHLFLYGPPGTGKTMLARRLPGLLPRSQPSEELEIAAIWSAADRPLGEDRPFRSPHHSISLAGLVGGGSGVPSPGEISLAHHGVLFLDELGEFPAHLLDALRQPIEEGVVVIARRGISVRFPTRVQVVAASNPCPCGFFGDRRQPCQCTAAAAQRYRRRISGPLLDRFDLRVAVPRSEHLDLTAPPGEPSVKVAARVAAAREHQEKRGSLNRDLERKVLDDQPMEPAAMRMLTGAVERLGLSGRGYDRVRRVARTVADLAGREGIVEDDIGEALFLRGSL